MALSESPEQRRRTRQLSKTKRAVLEGADKTAERDRGSDFTLRVVGCGNSGRKDWRGEGRSGRKMEAAARAHQLKPAGAG